METINPNSLSGSQDAYGPQKDASEYETRLTTRVFVLDAEGKLGLVRHRQDDMLFPPGGGTEEGETVFDGAKREVAEELGVVCEPVEDLGTLEHYHERWMKRFMIHHVRAVTDKQEIKVELEDYDTNLERVWMSIADYRVLLNEYLERKPDDVWAKGILYFMNKLEE